MTTDEVMALNNIVCRRASQSLASDLALHTRITADEANERIRAAIRAEVEQIITEYRVEP